MDGLNREMHREEDEQREHYGFDDLTQSLLSPGVLILLGGLRAWREYLGFAHAPASWVTLGFLVVGATTRSHLSLRGDSAVAERAVLYHSGFSRTFARPNGSA
jgi:hypothetical protein